MSSELDSLQAQLAEHFTELHRHRIDKRRERPLFALEHGLDSAQLESLATAVREHVVSRPPSRDHDLVWIVYSAEVGYNYAGDEYWQTFEQSTPGWDIHGDRYWIRDRYQSFQARFNGALPSGAWAHHFSIICWPITHAILPRDLQRQLARILYEVRHSFSADLLDSPESLGDFIAVRSWDSTSRFANFCQEPQLVGQIAAALLLQSESDNDALIFPATLKRIGEDLERERTAREWLRGARRFAREKASIRGLSLRRGAAPSFVGQPEQARREAIALGIEPRLMLRRTGIQTATWNVELEIPDLSHLLLRFPEIRNILTGSRCTVAGSSGRPLARGRLLHGTQRITLQRWPNPTEVLLRFEDTDPQLDYLLRTECLLRPGPNWLFRIASDGIGYESRGLRARAGQSYVVVSNSGPFESSTYIQGIELGCDAAHAALIQLPEALTPEWEKTLRDIGIGQARTIDVWPSGLAAAVWDGEGHGEWLASERPCIAISSDHPLEEIVLTLRTEETTSLVLRPIIPGDPVFVELPQLPVGLHTVSVSNRKDASGRVEPLGELDVLIRIREARQWSPGVSSQGPLLVQVEPPVPTLEQLWEGDTQITLLGPVNRHARCRVSFFASQGSEATLVQHLPRLSLPVQPTRWRDYFDKHVRRTPKAQAAYDAARMCELAFTAEELGAFSVRCERQFTPIRLAIRRDRDGHLVRLFDDTGDESKPTVSRSAFESPFDEESFELASEYRVPSAGGMYVARLKNLTTAIIAPPTVNALSDFQCAPQMENATRSLDAVMGAISTAVLWAGARLPGDFFSMTRKQEVLYSLVRHTFGLICGDNWATAEAGLADSRNGLERLQDAISRRSDEVGLGVVLMRDHPDLAQLPNRDRVDRIAELGKRFLRIHENEAFWLAELALRLASAPGDAELWAGERLRNGVSRLMELPTLARSARFLVLATHFHIDSRTAPNELFAGWGWK